MKRITKAKRHQAKVLASITPKDREELAKFAAYLRDPAPSSPEKYHQHYADRVIAPPEPT